MDWRILSVLPNTSGLFSRYQRILGQVYPGDTGFPQRLTVHPPESLSLLPGTGLHSGYVAGEEYGGGIGKIDAGVKAGLAQPVVGVGDPGVVEILVLVIVRRDGGDGAADDLRLGADAEDRIDQGFITGNELVPADLVQPVAADRDKEPRGLDDHAGVDRRDLGAVAEYYITKLFS